MTFNAFSRLAGLFAQDLSFPSNDSAGYLCRFEPRFSSVEPLGLLEERLQARRFRSVLQFFQRRQLKAARSFGGSFDTVCDNLADYFLALLLHDVQR